MRVVQEGTAFSLPLRLTTKATPFVSGQGQNKLRGSWCENKGVLHQAYYFISDSYDGGEVV